MISEFRTILERLDTKREIVIFWEGLFISSRTRGTNRRGLYRSRVSKES